MNWKRIKSSAACAVVAIAAAMLATIGNAAGTNALESAARGVSVASNPLKNNLQFSGITPVAPQGLGGLIRDHFSNGRLFSTVAWHGGLVNVSYWGSQPGGPSLFNVGLESAWLKLFRPCVGLGSKRYYLPLENTKLYPFGFEGQSRVIGVDFSQELLLLPDALVQRFSVVSNPEKLPVFIEMFHQEKICRVDKTNRSWSDFKFNPKLNAMISVCSARDSLTQQGNTNPTDVWVGMGCDVPMKARVSYNGFKIYFTSEPILGKKVSFFLVFADSEQQLEKRIGALSKTVNTACDELVAGYEQRLRTRPRIDVGNPVLNSAFGQYPEVINFIKLPDQPGAVRATQAGYFVWGWDGMTPLISSPLANEPEYAASMFEFFQKTWDPSVGIPHSFTEKFKVAIKAPFPAQAQYIASLYNYVALTGDLDLARKVMPICTNILARCRENSVKNTGLVSGSALWPDFPQAMGETGQDISSMNNSLLYQGLRSMEYLASALGDAQQAEAYREWAQTLRVSFVKYLYDQEKGYFITSCSSEDFSPRKHYGCQTIYWITPFARELVSHAPGRIASFMDKNLRSAKCLLSLPQWDTAWMEDGNQLGSSFPTADYFYLNMHKLLGDGSGLKKWMGDIEWFWRFHTAPEAFTPEAENEDSFGPDNHGGKQTQALTCWYACLYNGIAGMDFDHEGLTLTPWSDIPVDIRGLHLRGTTLDFKITGTGSFIGALTLNGKVMSAGSRKIAWKDLKGTVRLELTRCEQPPNHPVIVRADGLRIDSVTTTAGHLIARIDGNMTGEIVIQASKTAQVEVNGQHLDCPWESSTGTLTIPFLNTGALTLAISE